MIRTAAALLLFAVCAQPCVGQPGPQGDALQFHARCLGAGRNSFLYYKFSTKQHKIQPGDFLEYDVYEDAVSLEPRACVDLQYTDGRNLRDSGAADQRGLRAHGMELLEQSDRKWMHRKIDLAASVGKTIERWDLVQESDRKAEFVAYFDNVVITNGGDVTFVAWQDGEPDADEIDWSRGYDASRCWIRVVAAADSYAPFIDESRYRAVDLTGHFNSNGVGGDADFDGRGAAYDGDAFPKSALQIDGTPFRLLDNDPGPDNLACSGQEIPIAAPGEGEAISVHLLVSAAPSGALGDFAIVDSGGRADTYSVSVPDWCEDTDRRHRVTFDHRLHDGEAVEPACHIWLKSLNWVGGARPERLVFPDDPKIHVFAVTVEDIPNFEQNHDFCVGLLERFYDDLPGLGDYIKNYKYASMCVEMDVEAHSAVLVGVYNALRSGDTEAAVEILTREEEALDDTARQLRDYTISYLGNSHIDMAWLWRKEETVRVCRDTWGQALKFMEEFPEFTFAQSQPAGYLWMKELYPEIYAGMQRFSKEGRWEVVGGAWVESDCNVPSGESHVRQYLYGKRFLQKEFGVDVKVAWYPDTFGFNWNLPQIMRKAGIDYFMTTKINWNDTTKFPHNLFWWRAPDGSEVLSLLTIGGYGSHVNPEAEYEHAVELKERAGVSDFLRLYGVGDHGGGPSRKDIETALDAAKAATFPRVRMATSTEWFDGVAESGTEFPVWEDELYLENHRGCQTTQGRTKKNNRRGEVSLTDTEKIASFAWLEGAEYPNQGIEEAWRILLFNQFHDILPGSSIAPVYVDAEEDYAEMFAISHDTRSNAVSHLGWGDHPLKAGDTFVVVNTLSWQRTDVAEIQAGGEVHVVDSDGRPVPCQRVSGEAITLLAEDVPSMGWKRYRLVAGAPSTDAGEVRATGTSLGNHFFHIELDPKTGTLTSVRDKRLDWEVLAPDGRGNIMQLFDDNPAQWDAWNIGLGEMTEISDVKEMRVTETGPVRATVRIVRSNGTSTVTQDISIYNGVPRIDFRTHVDWQEKHKMLKVAFPLNVDADQAWYEIPYAAIPRSNKPETEAEKAKWEVAALRWASLSSDGKCVSLLNDCKYGYDCKDSVMRLSLLRAPTSPDPHADEGEHLLTYSLFTSGGDWRDGTVQAGRELNTPLLVFAAKEAADAERSHIAVEPKNVMLEAIKKAEDSDALILRLFEYAGEDCVARLKLPKPPKRVTETDLLEQEIGTLEVQGHTVVVPMGHNAITTVKVEF